jgi:hypothetical protein
MTAPAQITAADSGTGLARSVGRLLRTLRISCGLGLEDAAASAEVSLWRLRELEAGVAGLEYPEAIRLVGTYFLCPSCLRRQAEAEAGPEDLCDD